MAADQLSQSGPITTADHLFNNYSWDGIRCVTEIVKASHLAPAVRIPFFLADTPTTYTPGRPVIGSFGLAPGISSLMGEFIKRDCLYQNVICLNLYRDSFGGPGKMAGRLTIGGIDLANEAAELSFLPILHPNRWIMGPIALRSSDKDELASLSIDSDLDGMEVDFTTPFLVIPPADFLKVVEYAGLDPINIKREPSGLLTFPIDCQSDWFPLPSLHLEMANGGKLDLLRYTLALGVGPATTCYLSIAGMEGTRWKSGTAIFRDAIIAFDYESRPPRFGFTQKGPHHSTIATMPWNMDLAISFNSIDGTESDVK